MSIDPLNGLRLMIELNLGLEKSGKSQGILESGSPADGYCVTTQTKKLCELFVGYYVAFIH